MSKFYIDDYDLIRADDFEGKATLLHDNQETLLMFFNNECRLPVQLKLRQKYSLKIHDQLFPLSYRFITHSDRFETENKYNGPLGHVYHIHCTEFYAWAPTAYSMSVDLIGKKIIEMEARSHGVYYAKVLGNLHGQAYQFIVEHDTKEVALDPYAISSTMNSQYNFVVNPGKFKKKVVSKNIAKKRDAIIYECNVRDATSDPSIKFKYPGKYKGLCEKGIVDKRGNAVGFDYITNLGITHLQLLPVYDYGSIDESDGSVAYNWGYDPVQYNVPEGKYSCNPLHPTERINELIELVNCFKSKNIGVIMDVVYNHVYNKDTFSFEKLVPHYYFRYQGNQPSNASFCGNEVASERYMVRRFMLDSLVYLTQTFGFDGYRFDLMGIHDYVTMNIIHERLTKINPNILLYGEGWTMPTALAHKHCAIQPNYHLMPQIGFFNDDFRNRCKQVITRHISDRLDEEVSRLLQGLNYDSPTSSIAYVSCHDDYTLYDQLFYGFEEKNIEEKMKLAYTFVLFGQGMPFIHAGCEAARTKLGVKNSYNSSQSINQITWSQMRKYEDLKNFVVECIRMRKQLSGYFFNTKDEVLANTSISLNKDIITYQIKDVVIYINLSPTAQLISKHGTLLSCDGIRFNKSIEEVLISQYAVIQGE